MTTQSTASAERADHNPDDAPATAWHLHRERLAAWCQKVVHRIATERALNDLMGSHAEDVPVAGHQDTSRELQRRAALRAARPARLASWAAIATFGATAALTAQAAPIWQPEAPVREAIGAIPIFGDWSAVQGLITWTSRTPVLALLVWLAIYGGWMVSARYVARSAQHGRYVPATRAALAAITLTGAWLSYQQAERIAGTAAAFLAVGAVLAAWRALANTTAHQAEHVRGLNREYARDALAAAAQEDTRPEAVSNS